MTRSEAVVSVIIRLLTLASVGALLSKLDTVCVYKSRGYFCLQWSGGFARSVGLILLDGFTIRGHFFTTYYGVLRYNMEGE